MPLHQYTPCFILTAQNTQKHKYTHTFCYILTVKNSTQSCLRYPFGLQEEKLLYRLQIIDSVTLEPSDLTLKRLLRMQPGYKSFISLCLITSLCRMISCHNSSASDNSVIHVEIKPEPNCMSIFIYLFTCFAHHDYHTCYDCCENPPRDRSQFSSRTCSCNFEQTK